jgi:hypothetical protein
LPARIPYAKLRLVRIRGVEVSAMRSVPVVVPGIMGSTLAVDSRASSRLLWSDDFKLNYSTLLKSPGTLRWTGNRAYARLLNKVVFSVPVLGIPLTKFELWTRALEWIKSHTRFDGTLLVEYGYDWRAPLRDTAMELAPQVASAVGQDISKARPQEAPRLAFFMHSMGGLVVQLALGSGVLHPSWIDSLTFVGTPFKGSPAAFRSVYGSLSLPFFADIFSVIKRRNRAAFLAHLLESLQSFPSIYSLFPPKDVLYLYYSSSSRSNPLLEGVMPPEYGDVARETHELVMKAVGIIRENRIRSYVIYTAINANKRTDLEYRVTPLVHEHAYQVLETVASTMHGDGTVPAESARGFDELTPMTVTNVDHDVMCNSQFVVDCLDALFTKVTYDSSLQPR